MPIFYRWIWLWSELIFRSADHIHGLPCLPVSGVRNDEFLPMDLAVGWRELTVSFGRPYPWLAMAPRSGVRNDEYLPMDLAVG